MKKAIVLLLALTVIGGAVFAQVKVNAYLNVGAMFTAGDGYTDVTTYSDDWLGGVGNYGFVNVSYAGDTAGFAFRMNGSSGTGTWVVGVGDAYGWVKPLAGLKVLAGYSYTADFDGVDDDSNDYFDTTGASAIYEIAGVKLGAGAVLNETATNAGNLVAGAAYTNDMFKFRLSAQTSKVELNKIAASVAVTAVPDLFISGGYLAENMTEANLGAGVFSDVNNWIDATVKYTMGDLYAQAVMYYFLGKEYFTVAPRVGYKLAENVTVYGQLKYESEGEVVNALNPATFVPRVNVTYKPDAATTTYVQFEYDTEAEVSKLMLQYVFYF